MTELSGGRFYPGLISFPGVLPLLDYVESVAETQRAAREQSTVSDSVEETGGRLSNTKPCRVVCAPYQPVCIFMKS